MELLITTIIIFCRILQWIIIIDVILSWLSLVGIKRPKFIADILDPIYNWIKKYIPTTFMGLDFTPILIFLFTEFIIGLFITI